MKLKLLLILFFASLAAASVQQAASSSSVNQPGAAQELSDGQLQALGSSFSGLLQASSSIGATIIPADSSISISSSSTPEPGLAAPADQQATSSNDGGGDDASRLRRSSGSKQQQTKAAKAPVEFVGPIVRVHTASVKAKSKRTGFEYLTDSLEQDFEQSQQQQQLEKQQGSSTSDSYPWSSYSSNKPDEQPQLGPDPYSADVSYRQHPPIKYDDIPPGEAFTRYVPTDHTPGDDSEPWIARHPAATPGPDHDYGSISMPDMPGSGRSNGAPLEPQHPAPGEPHPEQPPPQRPPEPYGGGPQHQPPQQPQQPGYQPDMPGPGPGPKKGPGGPEAPYKQQQQYQQQQQQQSPQRPPSSGNGPHDQQQQYVRAPYQPDGQGPPQYQQQQPRQEGPQYREQQQYEKQQEQQQQYREQQQYEEQQKQQEQQQQEQQEIWEHYGQGEPLPSQEPWQQEEQQPGTQPDLDNEYDRPDQQPPGMEEGPGEGYDEYDSSEGGICLRELEKIDCRAAVDDGWGTQQFTSRLGCCRPYADAFKQPAATSVVSTAAYKKGVGMYPRAGHTECVWITHPLEESIHISHHVTQIGYATGTCYFGDAVNTCGGPFCDGLTITVQAEVYEAAALSRSPPQPRNTDDSCNALHLHSRRSSGPSHGPGPHPGPGPAYKGHPQMPEMFQPPTGSSSGPKTHNALSLPSMGGLGSGGVGFGGGPSVKDTLNSKKGPPQAGSPGSSLPGGSSFGSFLPGGSKAGQPPVPQTHTPTSPIGQSTTPGPHGLNSWGGPPHTGAGAVHRPPGNSSALAGPLPSPQVNSPGQQQHLLDKQPQGHADPRLQVPPGSSPSSSSLGGPGSSTNPNLGMQPHASQDHSTLGPQDALNSPLKDMQSAPPTHSPQALPGSSPFMGGLNPTPGFGQQQQQQQQHPQLGAQHGLGGAAGPQDRFLALGGEDGGADGGAPAHNTLAHPPMRNPAAGGATSPGGSPFMPGMQAPPHQAPRQDRTLSAPGAGIGGGFFKQPTPPGKPALAARDPTMSPGGSRALDSPGAMGSSAPRMPPPRQSSGLGSLGGIGSLGGSQPPSRPAAGRDLDDSNMMPPSSSSRPLVPNQGRTLDGPPPAPRRPQPTQRTLDGPSPTARPPKGVRGQAGVGMGRPPMQQQQQQPQLQPTQEQIQQLQRARNAQDRAQQVLDRMLDSSEDPAPRRPPTEQRPPPQRPPQRPQRMADELDRPPQGPVGAASRPPRAAAAVPRSQVGPLEIPELSSDYKTLSPEGMAAVRDALNTARQTLDELQRQSGRGGVGGSPSGEPPRQVRAPTRPPPSRRMEPRATGEPTQPKPRAASAPNSISANIGDITKDFFSRGGAAPLGQRLEKGSRTLLSLESTSQSTQPVPMANTPTGAAAVPTVQLAAQTVPIPADQQAAAVPAAAVSPVRIIQQPAEAPAAAPAATTTQQAAGAEGAPSAAPAAGQGVRIIQQPAEAPAGVPDVHAMQQPEAAGGASPAASGVRVVQQAADAPMASDANNAYSTAGAEPAVAAQLSTAAVPPHVQSASQSAPAAADPRFKAQVMQSNTAGTTVALSAQLADAEASEFEPLSSTSTATTASLWPPTSMATIKPAAAAQPQPQPQLQPAQPKPGMAATSASERPQLWGGKAVVISGQITSVSGPRQDFKFDGGRVEWVAEFHGEPLLGEAAQAALASDMPVVKEKVYSWVFDEGGMEHGM